MTLKVPGMVVIGSESQHHTIPSVMSLVQNEAESKARGGEVLTGVLSH